MKRRKYPHAGNVVLAVIVAIVVLLQNSPNRILDSIWLTAAIVGVIAFFAFEAYDRWFGIRRTR